MNLRRIVDAGRRGEQGATLPMALAFLVLFSVLIGVVLNYISTGMAANESTENQRDDLYAVSGAVDAAINRVRENDDLGRTGSSTSCDMTNVPVNGAAVTVECEPDTGSGEAIPTTAAPPFAILTTSPYSTQWDATYTGGSTYPGCSTISTQAGAELGVVQFQESKLLTITGNVYVNSDVDSDTWSGGCPNVFDALGIHVNGDVKVREGCNDMYPVETTYQWLCADEGVHTPAQAPRQTNGPAIASDPSFEDPAVANPYSWALPFTTPPALRTVPACPSGNVVTFEPGTYRDAVALSTLMNGVTCPGRVFWFKPGSYYFDFDNAGSHEWSINDGRAKIVAGQPTAVTTGGSSVGPTRWSAQSATSSGFSGNGSAAIQIDGSTTDVQLGNITTGPNPWTAGGANSATFANPGNATTINGSIATATFTPPTVNSLAATNPPAPTTSGFSNTANGLTINGSSASSGSYSTSGVTRWLTTGGYAMPGAQQLPVGATPTVQIRVVHLEAGSASQTQSLSVLVRDATDTTTLCTVTVPRSTSTADVTLAVPAGCLSVNALNTGAFRLRYQIQHSTCGSCNTISTTVDGLQVIVTNTPAGSITSGSVALTGFTGGTIPAAATINSVVMTVAHSEGTTNAAVINVPTVSFPGCTQNLTRRATLTTDTATLASGCLSAAQLNAGPTVTYNAALAGGSTSSTNVAVDGISLAVTYTVNGATGTATVNLSTYATTPVTNIPDDATITSVRLRVAHAEDNPNLVGTPSVVITPANSPACPAVNITSKHSTLSEDPAPSYDVTSCFSLPAQLNNGTDLQYRIAHCTPTGGTCTSAGTIARLDGIWLDVTYVSNPRLPWDPNDANANPSVPGACRHDGDPFWSDGVQWVFGGDSHINLRSGQMELCDKPSLRHTDPSLDQQEIVLFGVKPALSGTALGWAAGTASPVVGGTCPTTLTAPNTSSTFCQSASALALGGQTARALFATPTTTSSTITLAGGWSGTALPSGTTVTSVSARIAHRETSATTPVTVSGSAGPGCTIGQTAVPANVNGNLTTGTLATHFVSLPACVNANLASLSLTFNANYSCATSCPLVTAPAASILDGIVLDVTYSGASSSGGLTPQSGCITQKPYYNPSNHSPNYDNDGAGPNPTACALIKVPKGPVSPPPGDVRKLTLWGTAYAPAAAFDIQVDVLPVPVFNRGVVARMMMLGYQIENSTQVPFTTVPLVGSSPTNRTATFTATIPGKSTRVVAQVEFCDNGCDASHPPPTAGTPVSVIVRSWKVTR